MKGIRILIVTVMALLAHASGAKASEIEHGVRLQYTSLWGDTSYEITFKQGMSRLEWPLEMNLFGAAYTAAYRDIFELELFLATCPWGSSDKPMKDFDRLDEAYYPSRQGHAGLDIYSESAVNAKAMIYGANVRAFVHSFPAVHAFPAASMGLFLAYHSQETDFSAFDTRQQGYGSWQDQSGMIYGPTTVYTVDYDILYAGLTFRANASDVLKITLDASYIPYVQANDEDNHIRRMRISRSECTGDGSMVSLSVQFALNKRWYLYSSCSKTRIDTSGHQTQYWYGNDPATPNLDDTGHVLPGIDAEIGQRSFNAGIAVGCRF